MLPTIARVALPVPLDKYFDYTISNEGIPVVGGRVVVPFGRQFLVGIVIELTDNTEVEQQYLKAISQVLDQSPVWPKKLYELLSWCSQYYLHPLGDTFNNALPGALRKKRAAQLATLKQWRLTELGREQLMLPFGRAVKQAKVMKMLESGPIEHQTFVDAEIGASVLKALQDKGWIVSQDIKSNAKPWPQSVESDQEKPVLNQEQAIAIATVNSAQGFGCYLLDGVTGSGKTEVYLNLITPVLNKGQQALVLVPEIGLTPQTIQRFASRFNVPIAVIHSGLNESERLNAWIAARDKSAGIVIGTRSAIFTPFHHLGIVIVDEEHDGSYKQQDTLRYHARDVAIMRAHKENIPIVLGSATPALETLQNALSGKYHHLQLTHRAGNVSSTSNQVLDIKGLYLESGLSAPLIAEMRRHLEKGNQVLLFLNRRGFSPALMCHECGWLAECSRCDRYYTYYQNSREMCCHHCGSRKPVVHQCQSCGSSHVVTVGVGTEQLESQLSLLFPEYKAIRIDRDSTRKKGQLESALESIHKGEQQILIGTQMLAKGHHFPNVTLVALLDVDGALYSSDFRASERFAQLYTQVAGRAGRASKPGEVLLQTHHPEHTLLQGLLHGHYGQFATNVLNERKMAMLPPFAQLSLIRSEANNSELAERFLRQVRLTIESHPLFDNTCQVLGPTPSPITKRAGKSRWQMMLQTAERGLMQKILQSAKPVIQTLPESKKVRWSIDRDPQDLS
ncbi:primosomal protein N' [Vibrio sp. S4M6]|uniref:primosomal protein N' n=1 Tax=Vibrio sinus TaxID=2946865 RepID=UPI00202A2F6D|nr:primosomal protein N' [Vibrio sinus]MCL9780403.1 primosomal protein N' [Vibrio sinus]